MTKILLVDDNSIHRDIIQHFLIKTIKIHSPLHFYHANDGFQALNIVLTHKDINFIIMDISMPKCGGIEATRLIRKVDKRVKIYACTSESNMREKCLDAGMNGFFTKPFKTDYGIKINYNISD